MKTKLEMAHECLLKLIESQGLHIYQTDIERCFDIAEMMQAEADERKEAEAAQKRKEMREMLNAPNTFVEREGQHFDDVNWQPDWSQAPEWAKWWAMDLNGKCYWFANKPDVGLSVWMPNGSYINSKAPSFNYTGNWKESLRERPE